MTELTDTAVLAAFPSAPVDHDNVDFYRGLLHRKLLINRCQDCGRWHMPHRAICPACWSENVVATDVSGRGTVYTLIFLRLGAPADGVDYRAGHPVATIELEEQEGLRFTATLVDCPRESMRIGMPVELAWIEREGQPRPAFRPARETREAR